MKIKRIIAMILCISCVGILLMACVKKEDDTKNDDNTKKEDIAGMVNPRTEETGLDDINKKVGGNLITPPGMTVENEVFAVIDGDPLIAEYKFTLNGSEYTFRYSKASLSIDISGYWFGEGTAFEGDESELSFVNDSGNARLARWKPSNGEGQYVLISDFNVEQNDFMDLVYQLLEAINTIE